MDDVRRSYENGAPRQFYVRDGPAAAAKRLLVVVSDGVRGDALTPEIRAALVTLADLVEYERVGCTAFDDGGIELLTALGSVLVDMRRLRELVPPRLAHLRLWLSEPAQLPSAQPAGMSDLLWRECRREWLQRRLEQLRRAQACVAALAPFEEELVPPQ